ncbi:type III secretion system translocon subunit SctE [Microbulbifer variabilis]|uniref:type III secretion system translocon subunit SctE n=1 Tax=Microbulbifer variabilis TaxID=266805 RepID=UPI001CFF38D8|nr:type III secretion system translocon subunit SctE [Microbulbifer variabilis]
MMVNSINQQIITKGNQSTNVQDLSQQSLEIAQREKLKIEMGSLAPVAKSAIAGNTQHVELDMPETDENKGSFYSTLTDALSRLAGLMGDMADTVQFELQFKRQEIKRVLEEKLRDIQKNVELEQERKNNIEELEKQKKVQKIFGAVCNFFMGAAEVVAGASMVVGGVFSLNPALIAGGVCIAAAGAVEVAEGAVRLANGSEEAISRLTRANNGLLVVGVALVSFGAAAPAAGAMVGAKKGAKKGVEEGVESAVKKGMKEGAEKGVKEGLEKGVKQGLENGVEEGAEKGMEEGAIKGVKKGIEKGGENGAEKGAKETTEITSKESIEKSAKESVQEATKEASKATANKYVDRGIRVAATSATISSAANGAKAIHTAIKQKEHDYREAELENDIKALQARLESIEAKQEFINKLIQLLQEQWTRAIISPVQDAVKVLNNAIQDRAGVNVRIAVSHSI